MTWGMTPTMAAPSPTSTTPSPKVRRRKWFVLAAIAFAVGLVAAIVLSVAAAQRQADIVADYARAPAGCVSTLDFEVPGTYYLFVETEGELDDLPGNCDAAATIDGSDVDHDDIELAVTDPDGDEVDVVARDGLSYDTEGSSGEVIASIEVTEPGDHKLSVQAPDDVQSEFLIAVGRSPDDGVTTLLAVALAALVVGVAVAIVLVVIGVRRRPSPPAPPTTASGFSDTPPWLAAATMPPNAPPVVPPVPPNLSPPGAPGPWSTPPQTGGSTPPATPPVAPPSFLPPPPPGPR